MDPWAFLSYASAAILLIGGIAIALWALFRDRPRGRKRCPHCWYDLSSLTKPDALPTCPECGHTPKTARQLTRTRRRWGWAAAAMLPLVGGVWFATWPTINAHGWVGLIPTPVLLHLAFTDRLPQNSAMYKELHYQRFPYNRFLPGERRWVMNRVLRMAHEGEDEQQRDRAVTLLSWIGSRDTRVTPALLHAAAHDPSTYVRTRAASRLSGYLADAERAVPLLTRLAREDPAPEVRASALGSLGAYGPLARTSLSAAIAALDDEDENVRRLAIWCAARLGAPSDLLLPRFLAALEETTDYWERSGLISTLTLLKSSAHPAVPVLVQMFQDEDHDYPTDALRALGSIGPAAADALPALNAYLAQGTLDERLEHLATAAIQVIEGRHADMPAAHAAGLDHRMPGMRMVAAQELRRLARQHRHLSDSVVERLTRAALEEYGTHAGIAAHALAELAQADREPILGILRQYHSRDPELGAFILHEVARRETRLSLPSEPPCR